MNQSLFEELGPIESASPQGQAPGAKPYGSVSIAPQGRPKSLYEELGPISAPETVIAPKGGSQQPVTQARSAEQQARDEAQAKEAYERMTRSNLPGPLQQALAAASSYGRAYAPGVFEYLPAAGAKVLGQLGVAGYEPAAEASISDLRGRVRAVEEEAAEKYPKTAAAGTAAGLGAGIATLPTVTKLPYFGQLGLKGSAAATGALYGGISEGAEKGTLGDAATGAGLGLAAGRVLSPLVEKAISGTAGLITGGRPVIDRAGNLSQEAVDIARKVGFSDEKIAQLTPELISTFSERGLTPAAAREAPFRRFGIEPKRGMVTEDPTQLTRELKYGAYEPFAQQAATGVEEILGGQQMPLREAVGSAVERGEQEAAKLKGLYEQAYKTAGEVPGGFTQETLTNVGDKLLGRLARDETALAFRGSDHVQAAAKKLNENLGQFLETGDPAAPRVMWRNFRAVEEARKGLNQYLSGARDQTDRAGMRRLIDDFDQYVEDSINNGAFSGDKSVAAQWREGRKLFSQYQDKFGYKKTGEEAGSLMRQIIEGQKTPEDVGNMMFNFSSTGDAQARSDALKTFSQLERALGKGAPELDQIKKSFLQQIMTPTIREGERATPAAFAATAKQIDTFLKGNQATVSRRLLPKEDIAALQIYADMMRQAAIKPKDLTPEKMSRLATLMYETAPSAASAVFYSLANMHPALAAAVGALGGIASRVGAIKTGEFAARRAANLPPASVSRPYDLPSIRRAVPLAYEQSQQSQAYGGRAPRASGGRIGMTAERLLSMLEGAKRSVQKDTESLLQEPDEKIAKALTIAKEGI